MKPEILGIKDSNIIVTVQNILTTFPNIMAYMYANKADKSRSDCSSRSSLIRVHIVCKYAKIGLKNLKDYSADGINSRHFLMQVFLAF